jgi:uncharacterized protein YqjF (DUF2071 family)
MGKAIGFQRWDSLLFVHYAVPPAVLRPLIPARLELDTFGEQAYVSLTPFTVKRARLYPLPPLPGISEFHELNVRTYVRFQGVDPGVWFFSLEAASPLAAALARASVRLPYYYADISRERRDDDFRYSCRRRPPGARDGMLSASWQVTGGERVAEPGTLEHFLVERYFLYSKALGRRLWRGQVAHPPWPLRTVENLRLQQTLDRADHLPLLGTPAATHYSEGVDVEFLPLRPI